MRESNIVLHCGGRVASLDDVAGVTVPDATETYQPVGHYDLVTSVARVARDLLGEKYSPRKNIYALAKEGQRMFFLMQFQNGRDDMGLTIAGRNSYDKSMSVGFTVGASVFVCDNLALSGEVTYLRKHTANVWDDLETRLIKTLYKSEQRFLRLVDDAEAMKDRTLLGVT